MKVMLKRLLLIGKSKRKSKILLLFLAFYLLAISVFTPAVSAQAPAGPWYEPTFQEFYTKVYDQNTSPPNEIFGERYTAAQVWWVIYGLFALIIRQIPARDAILCLMNNDISQCIDQINQLLAGVNTDNQDLAQSENGSLFTAVFADRSFSGVAYVKEKLSKFRLVPEVKAQGAGFGFEGLSIVRELWRHARNMTYILFIFVIIFMAFMIMFRVKVSPQTVITVQSALPKIAAAIILVTFSYAIAGFVVDLMYVVIGLLSLMFARTGSLFSTSSLAIFEFLTKGALLGVNLGVLGLLVFYAIGFGIVLFWILVAGNGLVYALVNTFTIIPAAASILIGIIASIILLIVLLFASFKIVWMLIKTFANVLLLTVFAPFQIALGALTAGSGFGAWLKNFASQLAVFVVTGALFALSYIFLIQAVAHTIAGVIPTKLGGVFNLAPQPAGILSSGGWPPLLGGTDKMLGLLLLGVSLGILLLIPKAVDMIKGLLSGRPLAYGTAIGEAFGPVAAGYGFARRSAPVRGIEEEMGRLSADRFSQSRLGTWVGKKFGYTPQDWRARYTGRGKKR